MRLDEIAENVKNEMKIRMMRTVVFRPDPSGLCSFNIINTYNNLD